MKVALIVPSKEFCDEEYFTISRILEEKKIKTRIYSDKKGDLIGVDGGELRVENDLGELEVNNFRALILIGGFGVMRFIDNEDMYRALRQAKNNGILIAAMSIAPIILAKAGILQRRKATVWRSSTDKRLVRTLEKEGAIYRNEEMIEDDGIITASNSKLAKLFGYEIIRNIIT